ncbi:unnamed protein product [Penicillium salamii]|uniref:Major facilitator superfamily (MFS) profile domain-containing protein n=1 Tax=Penicillium salamii TaxID=1612424 RepID=A0A9W4I8H5_9EURO|nr:unnamed protein product [Penicillium salamii]CAG7964924.1 unnamed protein product [Penicillium salamii]CAG8137956.1 unnamed protein product [Penicillium salamii]CAG8241854.1 unnamed protein product [Penicillium salamii]CAG8256361.1 unnamed protein product [Penicillium salamii]
MQGGNACKEIALLGTALFMIAFGLGSLVSAPFSEIHPVYIASLIIFALFAMGAGLAPGISSWLACRFFAGLFGCPPLTNFGGTTADLWSPVERTYVFPLLLCLCFLGPFLAPMVAAFMGTSPLISWQWTEWLTLILTGTLLLSILLFVPETFAPVLLKWKAQALRKATGNELYRSEHEIEAIHLYRKLQRSVKLLLKFLLTEPNIQIFSLYMAVIYTVLFGFLPGREFIFGSTGIYGLNQAHTGLCYIAINIGFLLSLFTIWPIHIRFKRRNSEAHEQGKQKVVPEERLTHAIVGAPLLPISIFWIGWTSWPNVSHWSPLVGNVAFGYAIMQLYISSYQYIIDSYGILSASALVGMTVTRYCVAGPMVIVSVPMYENLGVHWTLTLLGCLAAPLAPVPYLFMYYGSIARKKSKGATDFE